MPCKICKTVVKRVDKKAAGITCYKCTSLLNRGYSKLQIEALLEYNAIDKIFIEH